MLTPLLTSFLSQDSKLSKITAVAIHPGNLGDSRSLRTNTPKSLALIQRFIMQPLLPVMRATLDPTMRTAREAGVDAVQLCARRSHPGKRECFAFLKKGQSSLESLDEGKQRRLWDKTLEWTNITLDDSRPSNAGP